MSPVTPPPRAIQYYLHTGILPVPLFISTAHLTDYQSCYDHYQWVDSRQPVLLLPSPNHVPSYPPSQSYPILLTHWHSACFSFSFYGTPHRLSKLLWPLWQWVDFRQTCPTPFPLSCPQLPPSQSYPILLTHWLSACFSGTPCKQPWWQWVVSTTGNVSSCCILNKYNPCKYPAIQAELSYNPGDSSCLGFQFTCSSANNTILTIWWEDLSLFLKIKTIHASDQKK